MHDSLLAAREPVFALVCVTLSFIAYFFIMQGAWLTSKVMKRYGAEGVKSHLVVWQRLTGFFFLGFIPFSLALILFRKSPADYGLGFENFDESLLWVLGFAAIILPMNYFNARTAQNRSVYPQMRISEWTIKLVWTNAWSWMAYLFAYELLFRGLLLFGTQPYLGNVTAIALNVTIYTLVHIPKGYKETLGSIPLGIVLCLLTLETGTIWVAFLTHVLLALSNDYFALAAHPDMRMKR
ncbi:MAG: CPBP family glutamic-type intramembrane protease [Bacteroidota bacterium]|nr:CPBP family glutamic-type intramembrane protease [Bacteroidota bacterium]